MKNDDDNEGHTEAMGEVFAMLSEKLGNRKDKNPKVGTPKEQVALLYEGYALLKKGQETKFKEGDIVRGVKLLTENQYRGWDQPHIITKLLDPPIRLTQDAEMVGHSSAPKSYNAIIGQVVNGGMARYYVDIHEFEHYPDAAKLIKKAD